VPGKHAPVSSRSFALSLARAVSGALAVVAVIVVVAVLALRSGDNKAAEPRTPRVEASPTHRASPRPTPGPTLSPSPAGARAPSEVTVVILNGTKRSGLARRTAERLRQAGYDIVDTGNAPATDQSTIFYASGARADALALSRRFPELGVLETADTAMARRARLTVVLGADFP
jgi:LytR cell envelope-related transcriptional attenuator